MTRDAPLIQTGMMSGNRSHSIKIRLIPHLNRRRLCRSSCFILPSGKM